MLDVQINMYIPLINNNTYSQYILLFLNVCLCLKQLTRLFHSKFCHELFYKIFDCCEKNQSVRMYRAVNSIDIPALSQIN